MGRAWVYFYLTSVLFLGAGGGGNDIQWCFSQVKGAVDDDVAEGKKSTKLATCGMVATQQQNKTFLKLIPLQPSQQACPESFNEPYAKVGCGYKNVVVH